MLFRTLRRMIENGQTEGLAEKIEFFYEHKKLTDDEYNTLMSMLKDRESESEG